MRAPFDRVAAGDRPGALWLLGSSAVAMLALLGVLDAPLKNATAPRGIISLQLAFDPASALTIVNGWTDDQRLLCGFGLGLDYLFMFLYPTAVAAACVFFGERLRMRGSTSGALGPVLSWVALSSGLFDMVENALLLQVLRGVADVAFAASVCAVIKFALLFMGLLYAVPAGIYLRATRTQ